MKIYPKPTPNGFYRILSHFIKISQSIKNTRLHSAVLSYFTLLPKFESLLLRHTKPWNRNGSRVLSCPLPLTLTLIGFFNDLPKAAHPGTCWISCSIRSADCWRIFWDILVQTYG